MKPRLNGDAGAVACTLRTHFTATLTHSPPLAPSSNVQQRNKPPKLKRLSTFTRVATATEATTRKQVGLGIRYNSICLGQPECSQGHAHLVVYRPLHAGMQETHLNPVVLLPGVRSGSGPSCTLFRRGTWADGALARGAGRSKSAGAELECSPMGGVE